jgi:hypothetical protein
MRTHVAVFLAFVSLLMAGAAQSATTVYLNRCAGGCTFTPGFDDSRTNQSSILSATSNLTAFAHGDPAFASVVACVETELAAFDVEVTTVDPGDAPHFEIAVAGTPQQVGLPAGVVAVAPLTCALVPNGIAFSFANLIGNEPAQICATAAQTVGNLVGLEFVTTCSDAMAFDFSICLPKSFLDEDAPCGTTAPAACSCGGTTQNSYQRMLATLPEPGGAAGAGIALIVLAALRRRCSSRWVSARS